MTWRIALLTLSLLLAPAVLAQDRVVVTAEKDLARYGAEFEKAGPERKAYLRHLRKLVGLTRKRLDGASSRGSPRWTQAMQRWQRLDRALADKIAGKAAPPAMFMQAGDAAKERKVHPYVHKEILVETALIHQAASGKAKVVGSIARGETPLIIGKPHQGWYKIARDGIVVGWVHEAAFTAAPKVPAEVRKAGGGGTPETRPLLDLAYGAFHALVIGNNAYQFLPKLKTAIADAREVSRVLRDEYGFTVTLLEDATRKDILTSVNKLRSELGPEDNLLIYYAGHGTLDRESDTGYWLPVDAEPDNDVDWIANAALTRHLKAMQANHVLVVADSCYSGTLFRDAGTELGRNKSERSAWLGRMNEKRSRTAIASGGLEPVMDSGGGRHSVFAKAFLTALRENEGVLDDHELYRRISRPVILEADQTPRFADIRKSGHEGGAFLFVPRR